MNIIDSPQNGRMRGQAVLLSASVPSMERAEIYHRIETSEAIEEAVVSVARAVFSEGGTLVFGGHPTISPLVALVVREYLTPRVAERFHPKEESGEAGPHVEIYQSEAYQKRIAEATERLSRQPGVTVHWVEAVGDEEGDPDVRDRPQAQESMLRMRHAMMGRNDLAGMVCIGGMEGVRDEAELFRKYWGSLPIYVLASTGGAARELARRARHDSSFHSPEEGIRERIETFWRHDRERSEHRKEEGEEAFAFPYAYVAQKIVAEIIDPEKRGEGHGKFW